MTLKLSDLFDVTMIIRHSPRKTMGGEEVWYPLVIPRSTSGSSTLQKGIAGKVLTSHSAPALKVSALIHFAESRGWCGRKKDAATSAV